MQLNITDLEAERKRREFARIEHAARVGGALPKPQFVSGRHYTNVNFGPVKIVLDTEIGIDPWTKKVCLLVADREMEIKLFEAFPDMEVTKKLYNYVFASLSAYMESNDGKLERVEGAQFCG